MALFTNKLDYSNPTVADMRTQTNAAINYADSYDMFYRAYTNFSEVLHNKPELDDVASANAVTLEYARAQRERAWLVCRAIHSSDGLIVNRSFNYHKDLAASAQATADLLHITADTPPAVLKAHLAKTKDDELRQNTRSIVSEHARTLFTIGRMGLVELLLGKDAERIAPVAVQREIVAIHEEFGRNGAYGFAVLGNQQNLAVEISAHAARAEMVQGGKAARLKAAHWLSLGLLRSMGQPQGGEENYARNVLQEFKPYVSSQKQAIQSVRLHP